MKDDASFINPKFTIRQALKQMSREGKKCLIVVKENKFVGTLSDGDIRRALLSAKEMDSPVQEIFNQNSLFVFKKEFSKNTVKRIFLKEKYDVIPILNSDNSIHKIVEWIDVFSKEDKGENLKIPVVIMAGGMGNRLKPFTQVLPKPLVPLNEKTVIENVIEKFTDLGIDKFFISINFKGKILKAFFEELNPSYSIKFIEEKKPLGTGGSLQKLKGVIKSTFMVTNCDVVIDIDHNDLIDFHKKNKCDLTLVASAKEIVIPYGACEINDEGYLEKILEKPKLDYLINTGLYVIQPSILNYIPKNSFFHITDLIEKIRKDGKKVGVFPIDDDSWIDVGQWEEYRNAVKRLN